MINDKAIRAKLQDRNLSEVARRIGITRSYLSKYMRGGKMGDETKGKLLEYLLNA